MTTLVLDPLTRVEGHLRIELDIEGAVVVRARSSGTSFRGLEKVLRGRDPRDAAHITQRICGVCPIPHARAACEAFEQAARVAINTPARLVRNIVQAANFIDSHLLHFYSLSLPDYVTGWSATGSWQERSRPHAWKGGEQLDCQQLAEHGEASFRARRACHEIIVSLAGKMPHAPGIVPGGATVLPSSTMLAELAAVAAQIKAFVDGPYAADMEALARAFPAYQSLGVSGTALLSFGAFPDEDGLLLLRAGCCPSDSEAPPGLNASAITESTAHSRYAPGPSASPAASPNDPAMDRAEAYSWIKAPRWAGVPCEVGPLARAVLSGRDPGSRGVMARHRARQGEASLLAASVAAWIAQLQPSRTALPSFPIVPVSGAGAGLTEGPRGALGHWLSIEQARVSHYAVVAPTTWNASPRDEQARAGPMERALQGVCLADPSDPIEAIRVVHSFDPCLQCAVH